MAAKFAHVKPNGFITALGYDPETRILTVYLHGRPYRYANVSIHKFNRFRRSDAPGTFYNVLIKGKPQEHPRVRDAAPLETATSR